MRGILASSSKWLCLWVIRVIISGLFKRLFKVWVGLFQDPDKLLYQRYKGYLLGRINTPDSCPVWLTLITLVALIALITRLWGVTLSD